MGLTKSWDRFKKAITQSAYAIIKDTADTMRSVGASVRITHDEKPIPREKEEDYELFTEAHNFDIDYDIPENIYDLQWSNDATDEEIGSLIASAQSTMPDDEIDDQWLDYASQYPKLKAPKTLLALPENLQRGWYPATIKPNIQAIKLWVETVKIASLSDEEIIEEYKRDLESPNRIEDPNWTRRSDSIEMTSYNMYKIKDYVVDSIAYKVARKIWYVGRRPTSMTDEQWDAHTKYRRPEEGSFGDKDYWKTFKYDVNYKYQSGVDKDI